MVQNIINIGEREDRILNIVKAKFGLKNKSEAVALMTQVYEENFLESQLKPEFLEELKTIRKGKYAKFSCVEELRKSTS